MMLLPHKRKAGECCCTLRDNYPPYQQLSASIFGLWLIFSVRFRARPGGDGGSKEKETKRGPLSTRKEEEEFEQVRAIDSIEDNLTSIVLQEPLKLVS